MKQINGYSNYYYKDNKIFKEDGTEISITKNKKANTFYCKLKNDKNEWKSVSINTIKALIGIKEELEGYTPIPYTDNKLWINENGEIISFAEIKSGKKLKKPFSKNSKKYPSIKCNFKGKSRRLGIHQLLAITFLDKDYLEKNLVAMHIDNNKNNNVLSNIKIGTYSENNRQAYYDGLNQGNKK
ncbi:MAG: hypothetical protein ACLUBL_03035 [Fusobacterium sp.]|uniref:hypothetical protein n=1 Tax=Fusobacterium sp. TaxID=68766 RepID=UPI0039932719